MLLFSYFDFPCFLEEKKNKGDPLKSQSMTYPFIAPPTTKLGSFGLNSKEMISSGDESTNTGSMEWISSKSQNTISDLWDLS